MKNTVEDCENQRKKIKYKLLVSITISIIILLFFIIGLSRAWFVSQANMETLLTIAPPSPIAIRGANGEALTSLDLSYTDSDKSTAEDGTTTVTIQRVISVCSNQQQHRLEIVHTTNLKGLQFNLYEANETTPDSANIEENGYQYTYDKTKKLSGKYINGHGVDLSADSKTEYGLADNTKHSENFGSSDAVQAHAEPLYWMLSDTFTGIPNKNKTIDRSYVNYYVIEISWTETTKESDIFYVLAKDA